MFNNSTYCPQIGVYEPDLVPKITIISLNLLNTMPLGASLESWIRITLKEQIIFASFRIALPCVSRDLAIGWTPFPSLLILEESYQMRKKVSKVGTKFSRKSKAHSGL
jgi:hypothetical protein